MRKEFPRTTPESVGVPSSCVEKLLDRLEEGFTEPHGLMLMRSGKVFAEGWWAPYAAGIRHGLQSHTKTYASTAVGIACTEGILKLSDRVIDLFPEFAPEDPSENLKKLTVRDVLCMGCGMDSMPSATADWIRDFLSIPVAHTPGSVFMYNSVGSTLLASIVKKVSGLGLHDYLKPRLFDKLGIDDKNLRWAYMPDGIEVGGGGLWATTEDNLRLLKLYADGGLWEGERILDAEFVRLASTDQNNNAPKDQPDAPILDSTAGYGFQMWMCKHKGAYRADGAYGQFTIVVPERDMILAITEYALGQDTSKTLDSFWEFLDSLPDPAVESLPEDEKASAHLARRLACLALPAPKYAPYSPVQEKIDGKTFRITDGYFAVNDNSTYVRIAGEVPAPAVSTLSFRFGTGRLYIDAADAEGKKTVAVALDGSRCENDLGGMPSIALCSGAWISPDTMELTMRMIENPGPRVVNFHFEDGGLRIETPAPVFRFPIPDVHARMEE